MQKIQKNEYFLENPGFWTVRKPGFSSAFRQRMKKKNGVMTVGKGK